MIKKIKTSTAALVNRTTLGQHDRELVLGVLIAGPQHGQDAVLKLTPADFQGTFPAGSIGHRLTHAASTPAAIPALLELLISMGISTDDVTEVLDDFRHHRTAFTKNATRNASSTARAEPADTGEKASSTA